MKAFRLGWITIVAAGLIGTAAAQGTQKDQPVPTAQKQPVQPKSTTPAPNTGAKATPTAGMTVQDPAILRDIEGTFGFVPVFVRSIPPTLLPGFWASMKMFQLGTDTKLDGKTKELIGLAVAAQIPCEYCIAFHTEAARMNGASDLEIQEAVGMAAMTREASTLINGMMIDKVQFKKDLDRIVRHAKQQARK